MRFELQKDLLTRYLRLNHIIAVTAILSSLILPFTIIFIIEDVPAKAFIFFDGGLILFGSLLTWLLLWHSGQFANSLEYHVDDDILYIKEGVFTFQRKGIPLDRVTDIRLVQSVLMRWVGIWKVQIQTASVGESGPEGILWAVDAPKEVRNQLFTHRKLAVTNKSLDVAS